MKGLECSFTEVFKEKFGGVEKIFFLKCFLATLVGKEKSLLRLSCGCKSLLSSSCVQNGRLEDGETECQAELAGGTRLLAVLLGAAGAPNHFPCWAVVVQHCSTGAACRYSAQQQWNRAAVQPAMWGEEREALGTLLFLCSTGEKT